MAGPSLLPSFAERENLTWCRTSALSSVEHILRSCCEVQRPASGDVRCRSKPRKADLGARIVRSQGFWDQERPNLRESLAHLVGLIMRRAGGDVADVSAYGSKWR